MSKQPTSKRQWRDGAAPSAKKTAKPFKSKARPKDETGKTASQPYGQKASDGIKPQNVPKQRAAKAKKLVVRNPNQKIMEHARDLKERRSDLSRMEPERLQKVLAASGVGSRREMEEWITNGWITVNGKTAQLGDKVTPDDHVTVKGSIIKLKWADRLPRIILYYKQEGEIVSRDDPQGRVSIFDRLPQAASSRWVAIGRLDINTSGLLILTTSGELVQRFAHPSFEVEREYAVRVLGGLTGEQMRVLTEEGVMLEDGLAKVERIREQGGEGANKWYNVGEIVSRDDPQGRVSIFDRLPQAASSRWVAIGRLDINTSGLLILTTSGELVQRFAHPSFEVEREYAVRVLGGLTGEQMRVLTEEGVMLEDGLAKVERIREQGGEGANKWYNVVIKEGRNREVRRIFESQGLTVSRLVRIGFGPIGLPNRLKRGQFYELNPAEVANIIKWADMLLPGERRRKKA